MPDWVDFWQGKS